MQDAAQPTSSSVPRLISELSAVLPLLPGDVIFTGTPAGVGLARNLRASWPRARSSSRGSRASARSATGASEPNFEVRLLSWQNDRSSDWHDHGGSSGAFYVADGALSERYRGDDGVAIASRRLAAGQHGAFGPSHVHDVVHAAGRPAVSVHAYSPPLTGLTYYDKRAHGFVAREVVAEPAFSGTSQALI
jgi:hypothetical protein